MKRNKMWIRIMSFLLIAVMVVPLTACNNNDKPAEDEEQYFASVQMAWEESGDYVKEIPLPEGVTLTDVATEDFTFTGFISTEKDEESTEIVVKNYTVEKKSDSVLKFTFTNPLNNTFDVRFVLASKKAITNTNKLLGVALWIEQPEFYFTGDTTGMYQGSDKATVSLKFGDNGKFVPELRKDMFVLPEELESADLTVSRVSDTEAKLELTNMPVNISSDIVIINVLSEAIDSTLAKDIKLEIDYVRPFIDISAATFSVNNKTIVIDNIAVNSTFSFVDGSVKISNGNTLSATAQSVTAENKLSVTFTSTVSDIYTAFDNSGFTVDVKTAGDAVLTVPFVISLDDAGIFAEVTSHDYENRKLEITFSTCFGTFADDVALDNFTVANASILQEMTILSKNKNEIVLSCSYPETTETSLVAMFTLAADKFETSLPIKNLVAEVTIPIIGSDRGNIDWAALGTTIGTGALSGLGSAIGGAAASFALPYVYEFLGVDTSDPQITAIQTKLDTLNYSIDKLSVKIDSILAAMDLIAYKNELAQFASKTTDLRSMSNKMLVNNATTTYVKEMSTDGQMGYIAFRTMMGKDFQSKVSKAAGVSLYNALINVAKNTDADYFDYADYVDSNISDPNKAYVMKVLRSSKAVEDDFYSFFIEATPCAVTAASDTFVNFIENNSSLSGIISKVLDYGNQILGQDLSVSIVDTYFAATNLIYNFESQTINMRKAYENKVFTTYLTAATFAIQYAFDSADSLNWSELTTQVQAVLNAYDKVNAKIKAMEDLAATGKDKILASSRIVDKKMTSKPGNSLFGSFVKVSLETYRNMNNRASKRNTSLIGDLTNAGFTGFKKDKSGDYVFAYDNQKQNIVDDAFVWELIGVVGGKSNRTFTTVIDLVRINSAGRMTEKKGELIYKTVEWHRWIYSDGNSSTVYYDAICVFQN